MSSWSFITTTKSGNSLTTVVLYEETAKEIIHNESISTIGFIMNLLILLLLGIFLSSEICCPFFFSFWGCISEILNFHSHLSFRLQYLYYSKSFACLLDDHATLHSNVRLVVEVAAQRCGTRWHLIHTKYPCPSGLTLVKFHSEIPLRVQNYV